MKLNLKRPLAFFDLETTGVNIAADRIVEISILKISPDGSEESKTYRVNPQMPIPAESSFFHGIYDEDVKDAPVFKDIAPEIADFLGDADLAGYNSNKFDIPLLMEEFLRGGVDFSLEDRRFVDVQNIFHQMEQRTLKAAYRFYCDKDLDNAHSAEADVRATYEVLKGQLKRYEGVDWEDKTGQLSQPVVNDVDALHDFTNLSKPVDFAGRLVYNEEGQEVINFGKHKGLVAEEVFQREPSYYSWMMNGDFPLYTKKCLEKIWNRFKEKQAAAQQQARAEGASGARSQGQHRPQGQRPAGSAGSRPAPHQKTPSKSKPVTDDMLQSLKDKFGKQ